jgi:hypothetical protein
VTVQTAGNGNVSKCGSSSDRMQISVAAHSSLVYGKQGRRGGRRNCGRKIVGTIGLCTWGMIYNIERAERDDEKVR